MSDPAQILTKQGENSQAGRIAKFTNLQQILAVKDELKASIYETIEIEKLGLKVEVKKAEDYDIPLEFEVKMNENPNLKVAFQKLTPGRQKGYLLHFSQPKQAKTREARVENCIPKILSGKGFFD